MRSRRSPPTCIAELFDQSARSTSSRVGLEPSVTEPRLLPRSSLPAFRSPLLRQTLRANRSLLWSLRSHLCPAHCRTEQRSLRRSSSLRRRLPRNFVTERNSQPQSSRRAQASLRRSVAPFRCSVWLQSRSTQMYPSVFRAESTAILLSEALVAAETVEHRVASK